MSKLYIEREVVEQDFDVVKHALVTYRDVLQKMNDRGVDAGFGMMDQLRCEQIYELDKAIEARAALSAAAEPVKAWQSDCQSEHVAVPHELRQLRLKLNALLADENLSDDRLRHASETLLPNLHDALLALEAASPSPAPAVPDDLAVIRKHNETIPAAMYPADPKPEERFARQVIAAYPDHAVPDAAKPEPKTFVKRVGDGFVRQPDGSYAKPGTQGEQADIAEMVREAHDLCLDEMHTAAREKMLEAAALLSAGPVRAEPLTDAQVETIASFLGFNEIGPHFAFARAIEAAHGIGKDQAS